MLFRHSSIPVNILAVAIIIRSSIQGRTKEEALPLPTSFPAQSIQHRERQTCTNRSLSAPQIRVRQEHDNMKMREGHGETTLLNLSSTPFPTSRESCLEI